MRIFLLAAAVGLAACATVPLDGPVEWNATLTSRTDNPRDARASVRALSGPYYTSVAIQFAGGTSGATHPWHVHEGTCATGGPIVGDPNAYPALRPGAGGNAGATARIEPVLMRGQNYHVNVHRSPTDLGTVISCGNLR